MFDKLLAAVMSRLGITSFEKKDREIRFDRGTEKHLG